MGRLVTASTPCEAADEKSDTLGGRTRERQDDLTKGPLQADIAGRPGLLVGPHPPIPQARGIQQTSLRPKSKTVAELGDWMIHGVATHARGPAKQGGIDGGLR